VSEQPNRYLASRLDPIRAGRRNATVKTTSRSGAVVIFGTEFRRLEQAQPSVVAQIEEVMRQRLDADSHSSQQSLLQLL
jgi:CRP-like cAMP-binding protein